MRPNRLQPARLLCPWTSPGTNTEAGCHFLLQGIGIKPKSLMAPALASGFFATRTTWEAIEGACKYYPRKLRHVLAVFLKESSKLPQFNISQFSAFKLVFIKYYSK